MPFKAHSFAMIFIIFATNCLLHSILCVQEIDQSNSIEVESAFTTNTNGQIDLAVTKEARCKCGKLELTKMEEIAFYRVQISNNGNQFQKFLALKSDEKIKQKLANGEEMLQNPELLIRAHVKVLSNEDDNHVYHASPIVFPGHSELDCVAVKTIEFHTQLQERKPLEMLTHELEMLEIAKAQNNGGAIQLIDGRRLSNAIFVVLEIGQKDLKKELNDKKEEWRALDAQNNAIHVYRSVQSDLAKIFVKMAHALDELHKFAIHFALKPSNWLFVGGALKLIDLQTSLASQNGVVLNAQKFRNFICKSAADRDFMPRGKRFASPEQREICRASVFQKNKSMQITFKADIWSFGIVACKILTKVPFMQKYGWKFQHVVDAFTSNYSAEVLTIKMEVREKFPQIFPIMMENISAQNANLLLNADFAQKIMDEILREKQDEKSQKLEEEMAQNQKRPIKKLAKHDEEKSEKVTEEKAKNQKSTMEKLAAFKDRNLKGLKKQFRKLSDKICCSGN